MSTGSVVRQLDVESGELRVLAPEEELVGPPAGMRWFDVVRPTPSIIDRLHTQLGLPVEATRSACRFDSSATSPLLPEARRHGDVLLIATCLFTSKEPDGCGVAAAEVVLIVADHVVVSIHRNSHEAFDSLMEQFPPTAAGADAASVLFCLAQAVIAADRRAIADLTARVDRLNHQLFGSSLRPSQLQRDILGIAHAVATMRGPLTAGQEIGEVVRDFFGDSHETSAGASERRWSSTRAATLRDLDHLQRRLDFLQQSQLAQLANQAASISKKIAVLTALTLPQILVSSFFGQNVPAVNGASEIVLWSSHGAALLFSVGMLWYARRRRWIGLGG